MSQGHALEIIRFVDGINFIQNVNLQTFGDMLLGTVIR